MDGDTKTKQRTVSKLVHDDSPLFQSVWIRHNTVLAIEHNWKLMASELRFVLLSGIICWGIHLFTLAL
jgi:predicted phosphohydrolase